MPTLSTSCVDTKPAWAGLSTETLTMLSGRLRLTGLCLSVFKCDGSLYFSDPEAGLFFTRFALPLVQFRKIRANDWRHLRPSLQPRRRR